jgi:hypothetical protein
MTIIASCGHEITADEMEECEVVYGDWSCDPIDGYQPCIVYALHCKECRNNEIFEYITTEEDKGKWLKQNTII